MATSETSDDYITRDPARIIENRQRTEQLRIAHRIARLPDEQWAEKVRLEKDDWQEGIWEFLRAIRTARQLRLMR